MRTGLRWGLGVLLALVGAVWLLQGVGVLPGSFMTGQAQWAVIGAGCLGVALTLLLRTWPWR